MCEPRRPVVGVRSRSRLEQRAATSPSARALRVASYVHACVVPSGGGWGLGNGRKEDRVAIGGEAPGPGLYGLGMEEDPRGTDPSAHVRHASPASELRVSLV